MRTPRLLATVAAAVLFTLAPALPASAVDPMQDRVDAVIAEFGGEQTAPNEVSWDDGAVILTLAPEGVTAFAIGNCPSGSYCAYSGLSYSGSRLAFSTCTSGNSVAALPSVKSIANSRTSGTVKAYNGSTLVATVNANTGKTPITAAVKTLNCS